ncbi:DUF2784 domain-containing protein [Amycolatopsis suaedae]|uniref:DUF2784 domain-containing protein n=1 Tax=Amycolatopsis suaedae TaxID=2510978 RepID=A0A4Q7JDU0_9PSEU|nr:DUF2784 domain-containing protein [Amycolatopsis suaedae]RZQ65196.1 DUF2784 domain-containing protein [Amycolatopsis suaedae]
MAALLAKATVALHILALLYIGLGGFLAWRWPKTVFVHVFFAAWGVAVNVFPIPCPLTALEDYFRGLQGLGPLPGGFNEYYLYDTIFPKDMLPVVAGVAAAVLVLSYIGAYVHWRHRHEQDSDEGPARRVRPAG